MIRKAIKVSKLQELLESGLIYLDDHTYVGKAWDDVIVQFGQVGEEEVIDKYLKLCPNPDCW